MLKTHISACLLTTALLAAPALAQTSTTTAPATPAPAGSSMSPGTTNLSPNANTNVSAGGAMASQGEFITQRAPGMIRASELIGMDVRGANNEDIGEVGDVLLDRSGQAQAVVIDVGGFLGIGETHVAIPMQALQFRSENQDTTATGSVNTAPAGAAGQNNAATTNNRNQASAGAGDQRPDMIVVVMTKDQLKSAPKFEDKNRGSGAGNTTGSTMGGNAPAAGGSAPATGTTTTAPKQ